MATRAREQGTGGWLDAPAQRRLESRVAAALRSARRSGRPKLISVTAPCGTADPTAVVCATRGAEEPWFVFEQPDRAGAAVAALGTAVALEATGEARFARVARRWRELSGAALADPPADAPGSGLVALGGFAFSGEGAGAGPWLGYAAASLHVPELSLARRNGASWLTVNVLIGPEDREPEALARVQRRLDSLREAPLPLLDPEPLVGPVVRSAMPPSHFEQAVARAVERIRSGEFEKVVLAREVQVSGGAPFDPAALLGVLRDAFRSCYVYAVGRGDSVFLGATPELLIRREGQRASTVALAGSTRRSADPAVDLHLGEQLLASAKDREENAIVARRIAKVLRPHALWVTAAPEPVVVRVANIQHLAAPIRAQLAAPLGAIELAGLLHPTPAVGGEPREPALAAIPALEGMDRGWYAGTVGWTDSAGDGEFCVALRCSLLRGSEAHLYAGCGIVRDSDPAAELAETETKLGALLPLLAG